MFSTVNRRDSRSICSCLLLREWCSLAWPIRVFLANSVHSSGQFSTVQWLTSTCLLDCLVSALHSVLSSWAAEGSQVGSGEDAHGLPCWSGGIKPSQLAWQREPTKKWLRNDEPSIHLPWEAHHGPQEQQISWLGGQEIFQKFGKLLWNYEQGIAH